MDTTINLRISKEDKRALEFLARAQYKKPSEYAREIIQEKLAAMPEQYRQAMELLTKPRTVTDPRETYTAIVQKPKKSGVKTP